MMRRRAPRRLVPVLPNAESARKIDKAISAVVAPRLNADRERIAAALDDEIARLERGAPSPEPIDSDVSAGSVPATESAGASLQLCREGV